MAFKEDKYEKSDCSPPKIKKGARSSSLKEILQIACKLESEKAFLNYTERLQMMFIPNCSTELNCKHVSRKKLQIHKITPRIINSIQMELSTNMWYEALEICYLSITSKQCLTLNVLRDIVEIMLNTHEDMSAQYRISHIISKCEQILALHFRMHPPCSLHIETLSFYNSFLMDPMIASDKNNKKHSTRNNFGCDKGIIQYCFNRLEDELSSESQDGPLINKYEIIPENLIGSVQGLHFEKEQLDLYELLERTDRIDRLMAVLRSTIELLQFNLFILKSRQSRQKMLMHKLFLPMEMQKYKVPRISKQIMKLFAYFVHLDYPAEHVKIMNLWLNIAVEVQISHDPKSNSNYPNLGSYGNDFAVEFYNIISDLPHKSVIKILDKIKPNYMKHAVGLIYCKNYLNYDKQTIINVLITFLEASKRKEFPNDSVKLLEDISEKAKITPSNILDHLTKICKNVTNNSNNNMTYPKFHSNGGCESNQNLIISALYISLKAYLESYNVENVKTTFKKIINSEIGLERTTTSEYTADADLFKVYTNIYQLLPNLILILNEFKKDKDLEKIYQVFEKLELDKFVINELKLVGK